MLRILACLLLFPLWSVAQPFRFTHLNQRNGLSQNTVTTTLRDSEGLIWLGTQDGLNVYDGYNFTIYRHNRIDSTSLSDNYILKLMEDKLGRIWIATRNGVCFFDKQERRFFRYYTSKKEQLLGHNQVSFLQALKNGEIVYSSPETGTVCLQENQEHSKTFVRLKDKESAFLNLVYCAPDESCRVFIDKVNIRIEEGKEHKPKFIYNKEKSKHLVTAIDSKQGSFFIADSLTIKLVYWKKSNTVTTILKLESLPITMLVDVRGDLWIGTQTGLVVIRFPGTDAQVVNKIKFDKNNSFSLAANQIESLYESTDGLIWVGTVGGGVSVFDPLQNDFQVQLSTSSDGLSSGPVWMTYSFGTYFLAGTSDAAFLFPKNKVVPHWWKQVPQGKKYTSACMDKQNKLWLGEKNEGLVVIDTLTGKRLQIAGANLLEGKQVMDIQNGPDESVWFCCIGGLFRYIRSENRIEDYNDPEGNKAQVGQRYFSAIRFTASGVAWIASNVGLIRLVPQTRETKMYQNNPSNVNSLSYNLLNTICLDSDDRIWVATMGSGFDLFDPKTETFTNYSIFQGLPNNTVYALEKDQLGKIWMSTNEGIVCFDPQQKAFSQYTIRDGLSSNEFVIRTHAQDAQGRIYFGSADGLVSFLPQVFNQRSLLSKPILKQVVVNFMPTTSQKLSALTHEERNLTFEFTAVDFRLQDKIQYAYQLVGFDAEWHENASGNRVATYTNLPYGDYTFRVRCRISNG
ncbi:MAG: two-component regulator propeller domain-containing protein, partial [Bacteroidia bacterium]